MPSGCSQSLPALNHKLLGWLHTGSTEAGSVGRLLCRQDSMPQGWGIPVRQEWQSSTCAQWHESYCQTCRQTWRQNWNCKKYSLLHFLILLCLYHQRPWWFGGFWLFFPLLLFDNKKCLGGRNTVHLPENLRRQQNEKHCHPRAELGKRDTT